MKSLSKLKRKLQKVYMKQLHKYAMKKMKRAYELEDKAIWLELEIREAEKADEQKADY